MTTMTTEPQAGAAQTGTTHHSSHTSAGGVSILLQELERELKQELEQANMRTEVAVHLAPLVDDKLEDLETNLLVVHDIVTCWVLLPESVREEYASFNCPPLERFVSVYFDEVDEQAWAEFGPADQSITPRSFDVEEPLRKGWINHVARLRERAEANEPPSEEWLRRLAELALVAEE